MSIKHPIVAVTGSSGAGTTTVMNSFHHIFRREGLTAQVVEGDSFHRYDRMAMRAAMQEAEESGNHTFSHFGPEANLLEELDGAVPSVRRPTAREGSASICTTRAKRPPSGRSRARSPHGRTSNPEPS